MQLLLLFFSPWNCWLFIELADFWLPTLQILDRGYIPEACYCIQLPKRNKSILHEAE